MKMSKPGPTRPDLDELVAAAITKVKAMTPAEREALHEEQRQSWARAEMELAKDPRCR